MALRSQGIVRAPVAPVLSSSPAAVDLSGHRAVIATGDGLAYPDLGQVEHADAIVGITAGAAAKGTAAVYQDDGQMIDPSWSWSIGPLFCGNAGTLTQTPPIGAWLRQIGEAVSATMITIHLFPSYYLRG